MSKASEVQPVQMNHLVSGTVFVVDDDEQVRRSIEQLGRSVGLTVVTFDSAGSFLQTDLEDVVGCIVTDVKMPEMSGLELQQRLIETGVELPLIVVTGVADVQMAVQALKCGAFDFIEKPFSPQAIIEVMQRAIESHAAEHARNKRRADTHSKLASLSERETEVLQHLVAGKTTKRIAARLGISLTTVDYHRNNILEKMGVENLVELTREVGLGETGT